MPAPSLFRSGSSRPTSRRAGSRPGAAMPALGALALLASVLIGTLATVAAGEAEPAVALAWLDTAAPATAVGVAWGVPWPRGMRTPGQRLVVRADDGGAIPTQ